MSLRLLLDEDSQAQLLVKLLTLAGHDVLTINQASLTGSSDEVVLECTRKERRILLTHNCDDFEELHLANPIHPGILAIYRDDNLLKNMSFKAIVKAIANLEAAQFSLAGHSVTGLLCFGRRFRNTPGQFVNLNQWNY